MPYKITDCYTCHKRPRAYGSLCEACHEDKVRRAARKPAYELVETSTRRWGVKVYPYFVRRYTK